MVTPSQSNFAHLESHDEQLVRLGMLAEQYFRDDPNTSLLKLRQVAELLAQLTAANAGLFTSADESQYDLLRRLQEGGILPPDVYQLFSGIRRAGNAANHALADDYRTALITMKMCWQLGVWFHRTFRDPAFKSGPFAPPTASREQPPDLTAQLAARQAQREAYRAEHEQTVQQLSATESKLRAAADEGAFWTEMAEEADRAKAALEGKLAELQAAGATQSKDAATAQLSRAKTAAGQVILDEADTRRLIDEQLRRAGWEADSATFRHALGTRPQKGRNIAIAEWPTSSGPADYVLFAGLTPIATVEAKRRNKDVSAFLQQAARYSRGVTAPPDTPVTSTWDGYRVPFAFSANGRPYLRQLAEQSGIWFRDLRRPANLGRVLPDWYTPEGLAALLKQDEDRANDRLKDETFQYGFPLRRYQRDAILAVEAALAGARRDMLLAMATGTGKTKTCIALVYRLLKTQRFRRVLFLVDRSALGDQAADAFKDTRMESLQTFADTFGLEEIDARTPDAATKVHISTVQGMVSRILNPREGQEAPAVDTYDCVIVDECHRGYLLDRDLSDTELTFRSFDDYVSKYRRVLDHFDAVKIGLTATPALHTTDIFGLPVFSYPYREAVIDGFLVDHEPPIKVITHLSAHGIVWQANEEVKIYEAGESQLTLFTTPDEIKVDVSGFNRQVITEEFNRVVCEVLAREIDPSLPGKTLIFCADDRHADLVVRLLKEAFERQYGEVDDDAVIKITGKADNPIQLIRRYKNERNPNVAVTVDLLTTGIDVPAICNLVFLRRVNSRILFDQMLGRATRLCDEIGKDTFRVFDAVGIFETIGDMTAMQPVVADPKITFDQLVGEIATAERDDQRTLILDQLIAKLQRKKARLTDGAAQDLEAETGEGADGLLGRIRAMPPGEAAAWFAAHPRIGEILDRRGTALGPPLFVSEHPDQLPGVERSYGAALPPKDYIEAFTEFVKSHINDIPALMTVVTRPRELTRKQLRELALALDRAGYPEASLTSAYHDITNKDIAARIVGFVRQAALGDPLVPYAKRVDDALDRILASQSWSRPQAEWLKKIAAQTKANTVVDLEAIDDPNLPFRREGGGVKRLDKLFEGNLETVLANFNDYIWEPVA